MQRFRPFVVDIHATGRHAKEAFMEAKNIPIHIWIDDNPHFILMDAYEGAGHYDNPVNKWHNPIYSPFRTKVEDVFNNGHKHLFNGPVTE